MMTQERKILIIANLLIWPAVLLFHFKKKIVLERNEIVCHPEAERTKPNPDNSEISFKNCK